MFHGNKSILIPDKSGSIFLEDKGRSRGSKWGLEIYLAAPGS